jgi:hypothetical protein
MNMMRKVNQWCHGDRHFVLPPLPDFLLGVWGCRLQRTTFDPEIGEEVHALYLEKPQYLQQLGGVHPFNMFARTGVVRTPHGIVAFIVWVIAAGSPVEVLVEQYLNPYEISAIHLLSSAANQTHFKLVVANNRTSEVTAFIDFENVFEFDKLVEGMARAIGHEPMGDFGAAMQHVMDNFSIKELMSAAM